MEPLIQRVCAAIGVDENIIAASWGAMEDAYNYGLLRQHTGA